MNRIDQKFQELSKIKQKAFIAFMTAGDPNLRMTESLTCEFEKCGVDIVELGIPFSDPLADGPVIQASSQRSLKKGTTVKKILESVKRIRTRSDIPIALMTYYNPIYHYGEKRFIDDAAKSGVDGLIIPDLPPEESRTLIQYAKKRGLSTVFFVAPTTRRERMKKIVRATTGFIYYVAFAGVTGGKKGFSKSNSRQIQMIKRLTRKPVCVGFGVSTPIQVKSIAKTADGVIVGSAIVKRIHQNKGKASLMRNVSRFVWSLSRGLKND